MTAPAGGSAVRDRFIIANGLRTHCLEFPGDPPTLVLLHGLSANAHAFGGIVAAGLAPEFRILAPDLRGRGQTDKPATGYRMADHAADVLALLDALGLQRVVLGGHSFGALLTMYLAAHFPERVSRAIIMDAALRLQPGVRELLKPSLDRLGQVVESSDEYLGQLRHAPYLDGQWDPEIEAYFRAEIEVAPDGTARSVTSASAIAQALDGVLAEDWAAIAAAVRQPAILLNALAPYGPTGAPPLILEHDARDTARTLADCRYATVPGNHFTMLFGEGARAMRREIERFVRER